MFDYNLLGRGYVYGDLRNVTSSLSEKAGRAFLEAYGAFDEGEKAIDNVISPVVTLHMACGRKVFPAWAQAVLKDFLENGEEYIRCLIDGK